MGSIDGTTSALGTTDASSLTYTVTFSKPVTGFATSEFAVAATGTVTGTVALVTPVSSSV